MVPVVERRMIVPNLHLLTVEAPEVAAAAQPGNFVILRPDDRGERIPLTMADWDADAGTVTSIFAGRRVDGEARAPRAGDTIPTYAGPLGNETEIERVRHGPADRRLLRHRQHLPGRRALCARPATRSIVLIEARSAYLLYWEEQLRARLPSASSRSPATAVAATRAT